jgi:hypothetical protein
LLDETALDDGSSDRKVQNVGADSSAGMRTWLSERSLLADGKLCMSPCVAPRGLLHVIAEMQKQHPSLRVRPRRKTLDGWPILRTGLLRSLCCLSYSEIGTTLQMCTSTARNHRSDHAQLMKSEPNYAIRCAAVTMDALRRIIPLGR